MTKKLTLGVSQSRTLATTELTLDALARATQTAASRGVDILLFPEAYLGGYPRTCAFGSKIGARSEIGRDQFLDYYNAAIDFGDTPAGAGDDWVNHRLPIGVESEQRGDGTREVLERVARETGVFLVVGAVERSGGSLYCTAVYVCPTRGVIGKRRKVMPTGSERLVWAQGAPETLKAVVAVIKGVRVVMAAAICWENYMPLLRQSLYAQNVNLYLAPTADARDAWPSLMRTIGIEGRTFVLSANQCVRKSQLPDWIQDGSNSSISKTGGATEHARIEMGGTPSLQRGRRRSTITIPTEDQHEICLPVAEEGSTIETDGVPLGPLTNGIKEESHNEQQTQPRRRSIITETPEHHEISWPIPKTSASSRHTVSVSPSSSRVPALDRTALGAYHGSALSISEDVNADEYVSRGGSSIVSPMGDVLAGPLWEKDEGLLVAEVDFDDCIRGRLDLDVAGSYSRSDSFKLTVEGLDLSPPP